MLQRYDNINKFNTNIQHYALTFSTLNVFVGSAIIFYNYVFVYITGRTTETNWAQSGRGGRKGKEAVQAGDEDADRGITVRASQDYTTSAENGTCQWGKYFSC